MTCINRRNGRRIASFQTTAAARTLLTTAVAMASVFPTLPAQAAPAGGVITAGAGVISQQGATTTINQSATQPQGPARMVINWNSFSSAAGESIVFNQPNAAAIALNRITGASPSQLMGNLRANGQIFILNPNGVLFGPGSQVNVRGLLASTLGMDDTGFMNGSHMLQGSSSARVINQGSIKAADGGYVALVGPAVVNDGTLSANKGDALLAAGNKVTLRLEGGSLLGYTMDLGSVNALVDNTAGGVISANGGRVVLEARAADALSKAVVNHAGVIEARTLDRSKGNIMLIGDLHVGQTHVSGTLDASAPNGGDGGFIETSAAHVKIADSTKVTTMATSGTTGKWLIDPVDFEIAPDFGERTNSSIGAKTLAAALGNTSTAIGVTTSGAGNGRGDITVNAEVAWVANTELTLQAYRNIIFNATLRGRSVSLLYGQATPDGGTADFYFNNGAKIFLDGVGGTFNTQKGNTAAVKDYTIVRSLGTEGSTGGSTLQGVSSPGAATNYALGADINATATSEWNSKTGFSPLPSFNGTFQGLGHEIIGLNISRRGSDTQGLFSGIASGAEVRDLGITKASIVGNENVGALAGSSLGTIRNVFVTGKVVGTLRTGGLVGSNSGTISTSYSEADVKGLHVTGGLVGENSAGAISNSYASGPVLGKDSDPLTGSFSGGLVGFNRAGIAGSYASGITIGNLGVGGLVGGNAGAGAVKDSYAQGQVDGQSFVGGLVGQSVAGSTIKNSYASGAVKGAETATTGGLVGASDAGVVSNSYWNTDSVAAGGTGQATPGAGDGKTGAQLRQAATFSGWDIATTGATEKAWRIYEGKSMPLLRSLLAPLVLETVRSEYSAAEQQGPAIPSVNGRTGVAASGRNVGTYLPYSTNQQGYDINNSELVITPHLLALTATAPDKVYDGNPQASVTLDTRPLLTDKVTATFTTAAFDNKNVGDEKTVTVTGITLGGKDAGNYSFQNKVTTTGKITPFSLFYHVEGVDKVYDGTTNATVVMSAVKIHNDDVFTNRSASFDNKNAGAAKTVTITVTGLRGTEAGNYTYTPPRTTTASITQRPINITATAADKAYDGTTQTSAALADNRLAGDAVTASYQRADFADKNGGQQKTVTVSGVSLTGADAANYLVDTTTTTTSASIKPIGLTITANPDAKLANNVPYQGGNGVTYAGFIPGETAAVLAGQLRYGGNAQGATKEGVYRITPGGLTSVNYASTFVDGALTIQPLLPDAGPVAAYIKPAIPVPLAYASRNTGTSTLRVVDCGMRLPEDLLLGGCQPASQPDNPGP